ncbi:MAG: nitrogenase [Actinobacteria bacterium]|nr:nitrogenase [Actinomycetota bacterium]
MAKSFVSTTNPCRLCRPLGACLAFRGVEDSMVLLHGSQGCSTYMRRYISSHFREPVDIASSALSENQAVYGGAANLKQGIRNVVAKYSPAILGVATTCLAETIGDDVRMTISELMDEEPALREITIVPVSTPSYNGGHMDGFNDACVAILESLAGNGNENPAGNRDKIPAGTSYENLAESRDERGEMNLFPGFVSPADLRYLKEVMASFGIRPMVLPDISDTLDGVIDGSLSRIPSGGARLDRIRHSHSAPASIEFGRTSPESQSPALFLEKRFGVKADRLPIPIGIRYSDLFFESLERLTGRPTPDNHRNERGRLVDAMVDAHKYLFGKRAVIYGDADFVIAMTSFLVDLGIQPVVCASGGGGADYLAELEALTDHLEEMPALLAGTDFEDIREQARKAAADLLIGSSKGNHIARELGIPLVRAGYPIHDRFGGQRILHTGYRGALNLLDLLTNTIIAGEEAVLGHGYSYM